jgi:hypothetical protein
MDRRRRLLTSLAAVLAAPLRAEAQSGGKVWRIGYLGDSAPPSASTESSPARHRITQSTRLMTSTA